MYSFLHVGCLSHASYEFKWRGRRKRIIILTFWVNYNLKVKQTKYLYTYNTEQLDVLNLNWPWPFSKSLDSSLAHLAQIDKKKYHILLASLIFSLNHCKKKNNLLGFIL